MAVIELKPHRWGWKIFPDPVSVWPGGSVKVIFPGQHSIVTAPADNGPLPVARGVTDLGSGENWVDPSPVLAAV